VKNAGASGCSWLGYEYITYLRKKHPEIKEIK